MHVRNAGGVGNTSIWFRCRAKARSSGIAVAARISGGFVEKNRENDPDVNDNDAEEREEAVFQSDATGMLQQQREITDDEIEENIAPPDESR